MDRLLYIAMSGADQINRAQTMHANNLANVGTTGFRADLAQARAMQVIGEGYSGRVYAMTENPASNFQPGSMIETGRQLDVAIKGSGFLSVDSGQGQEAFTRAGNLTVDSLGMLRTAAGHAVLGDGGPIVLPPYERLMIGSDGTITVQAQGQGADALVQVSRIKLVDPQSSSIAKSEDGLFRRTDGGLEDSNSDVQLVSGFLESSNVNAVNEMTEILAMARQFELQVRMMQTAKENDESAAQLLRIS